MHSLILRTSLNVCSIRAISKVKEEGLKFGNKTKSMGKRHCSKHTYLKHEPTRAYLTSLAYWYISKHGGPSLEEVKLDWDHDAQMRELEQRGKPCAACDSPKPHLVNLAAYYSIQRLKMAVQLFIHGERMQISTRGRWTSSIHIPRLRMILTC